MQRVWLSSHCLSIAYGCPRRLHSYVDVYDKDWASAWSWCPFSSETYPAKAEKQYYPLHSTSDMIYMNEKGGSQPIHSISISSKASLMLPYNWVYVRVWCYIGSTYVPSLPHQIQLPWSWPLCWGWNYQTKVIHCYPRLPWTCSMYMQSAAQTFHSVIMTSGPSLRHHCFLYIL